MALGEMKQVYQGQGPRCGAACCACILAMLGAKNIPILETIMASTATFERTEMFGSTPRKIADYIIEFCWNQNIEVMVRRCPVNDGKHRFFHKGLHDDLLASFAVYKEENFGDLENRVFLRFLLKNGSLSSHFVVEDCNGKIMNPQYRSMNAYVLGNSLGGFSNAYDDVAGFCEKAGFMRSDLDLVFMLKS
jgi:hypothetical protein